MSFTKAIEEIDTMSDAYVIHVANSYMMFCIGALSAVRPELIQEEHVIAAKHLSERLEDIRKRMEGAS